MTASMNMRRWLVTLARGTTLYRAGTQSWAMRYYTAEGARMNRTTAFQLEDAGMIEWEPTEHEDIRKARITVKGRSTIRLCPCHQQGSGTT